MGSNAILPVVTACVHCEWAWGFSMFCARAVIWEDVLELNFSPLTARARLRLTKEALSTDVHSRLRYDSALQLLSISFPKSYPDQEPPFVVNAMELIARNDHDEQLRWAIFATSEFGSFVEILECEDRQAATVLLTPNGFAVSFELEADSRIVPLLDTASGCLEDVILSWGDCKLEIVRNDEIYEELKTLLSEEDLLFLIQDKKKSYQLLYFEHCFARLARKNFCPEDEQHCVLAYSLNKRIILVSGSHGSLASYYDRKGNAYDVELCVGEEEGVLEQGLE